MNTDQKSAILPLDRPVQLFRGYDRNSPCPCGSGTKAKGCCGAATTKIVKFGHPSLKAVAAEFTEEDLRDVAKLRLLRTACEYSAGGVGLSGNQIDWLRRAVFVAPNRTNGLFMLNPEIIDHSAETNVSVEGCLSFPGVRANVERFNRITVQYRGLDWMLTQLTFVAWSARVVQHEIDHLSGICRVGEAWELQRAVGIK